MEEDSSNIAPPGEGGDAPAAKPAVNVLSQLFIGNLSHDTVEQDLREVFTAGGFGVGEVRVVKDPETGRPRGFAFVELTSRADIQPAIKRFDHHELKGRSINVREAKERPAVYTPRTP